MEDLLHRMRCLTCHICHANLKVNSTKTAKHGNKCGNKSLRPLSQHVWNSLPKHIKSRKRFLIIQKDIQASGLELLTDAIYVPMSITLTNDLSYNLGFDPFTETV